MPMNINPMQLIQMIKRGQNPQQLVMNMLEQQMQNANTINAGITNLGTQLQQCCCQNRYEDAQNFAQLNYNLADQECSTRRAVSDDLMENQNANTRSVLGAIQEMQTQALHDKITELTGGTAGAISLTITIDGEAVRTAQMIVTPAAVEQYFNVASCVYIDVPTGCCSTAGVTNTSNQTINVQNANLIVERVA